MGLESLKHDDKVVIKQIQQHRNIHCFKINSNYMKKVIIAKGSSVIDFDKVKGVCDYILENDNNVVIVSGGNCGVYDMGVEYAVEYDFDIRVVDSNYLLNNVGRLADTLIVFLNCNVWKDKNDVLINDLLLNAKCNNLNVNIINT